MDGSGGLRLLSGDAYTITAKAEGYREADTEMFTAAAEMIQIDNLMLLPVLGQFFIEGHVTDSAGNPVRGARLHIQYPEFKQTLTDEDGGYRFEDLSMAVINELNIDHTDLRVPSVHDFEKQSASRPCTGQSGRIHYRKGRGCRWQSD